MLCTSYIYVHIFKWDMTLSRSHYRYIFISLLHTMTDIDTPFLKHNLCRNMFLSVGYVEQAVAFLISHLIEILLHPCAACCKFYNTSPCFFSFFSSQLVRWALSHSCLTFFSIIILSALSSTSRVRTAKFSPAPNTLESRSCVAFSSFYYSNRWLCYEILFFFLLSKCVHCPDATL